MKTLRYGGMLLGSLALLASGSVSAVVIDNGDFQLFTKNYGGNDCAGEFGKSFEKCAVDGSPVIAKIDYDDDGKKESFEVNEIWKGVVSADSFVVSGTDGGTGTWAFAEGYEGPAVRFWVAKGGPEFRLHWLAPKTSNGDLTDAIALSDNTLFASYAWQTTFNEKAEEPFGLSHLTWYNTEKVSEPAALGLLGLGLLGLGWAMRRRNRNGLQA